MSHKVELSYSILRYFTW